MLWGLGRIFLGFFPAEFGSGQRGGPCDWIGIDRDRLVSGLVFCVPAK